MKKLELLVFGLVIVSGLVESKVYAKDDFEDVPDEVVVEILKRLDPVSHRAVTRVNTRLRDIALDKSVVKQVRRNPRYKISRSMKDVCVDLGARAGMLALYPVSYLMDKLDPGTHESNVPLLCIAGSAGAVSAVATTETLNGTFPDHPISNAVIGTLSGVTGFWVVGGGAIWLQEVTDRSIKNLRDGIAERDRSRSDWSGSAGSAK
jgi:hypothetical protein